MRTPSRTAHRAACAGALALGLAACDTDRALAPAVDAVDAVSDVTRDTASLSSALVIASSASLPQKTVSTTFAKSTGKTITVKPGSSLQSAIDAAVPGDVIVLQAGATYTGNYILPKKSGTGWVTIRTSTSDSYLPAGKRVIPSQAGLLAKVHTHNSMPAFRTKDGAHHYRLIGLEISTTSAVPMNYDLVAFGASSSTQKTLTQVPNNLVIERSYIHGRSTLNLKNCVAINSAHTAIVDSYISQCHWNKQESHGIIGWNGPGPFLIENNYVEGSGINVMFGGGATALSTMVPSDITIRRNHIVKPLAWKGKYTVKNLVEFKIGRRILIEDNILENSWADGQTGPAFVIKTEVNSSAHTWGRTEDVTVRYNVIRNVAMAANIQARQGSYGQPARDIRFEHNVWDGVGSSNGTGIGRAFQVLAGVHNVQFERNTLIHNYTGTNKAVVTFGSGPGDNFVFRDNVTTRGLYAVKGNNLNEGTPSITRYAPNGVFVNNVLAGKISGKYPAGNHFPTTTAGVGFVSLTGKDYRLSSSSPFKGKASDGTDPGANVALVNSRTSGVIRK